MRLIRCCGRQLYCYDFPPVLLESSLLPHPIWCREQSFFRIVSLKSFSLQAKPDSTALYYSLLLFTTLDYSWLLFTTLSEYPVQPLRWLITVSSTFQEIDFDAFLLPLFITSCYNHGIKILPNHRWTRWYHFRDTVGYYSNTITC